MEQNTAARTKQFDEASADELAKFVEGDRHSFRAQASELSEVSINPKSTWHSVMYSNDDHVGIFRFQHHQRGTMVSEFMTVGDMREALNSLPSVLGEKLAINVLWDEAKQTYVKS